MFSFLILSVILFVLRELVKFEYFITDTWANFQSKTSLVFFGSLEGSKFRSPYIRLLDEPRAHRQRVVTRFIKHCSLYYFESAASA